MANELMTMQPMSIQQMREVTSYLKYTTLLSNELNKNEGNIFLMIMMGQDLGLSVTQSLTSIYIVKGKPYISGQLMLALIEKNCPDATISIKRNVDDKGEFKSYTCFMKRAGAGGSSFEVTWDFNRASVAGLYPASKPEAAWAKYPDVMCKWRAVSECARTVFPDVIQGFYAKEEINDEEPQEPEKRENLNQPKPNFTQEEKKEVEAMVHEVNEAPKINIEREKLEVAFAESFTKMANLSIKKDKSATLNEFKKDFDMKSFHDYKKFTDEQLKSYTVALEDSIIFFEKKS